MLWLLAVACSSSPDRRSVLVLTVDGMRADRIGAYGYVPSDTPQIDRVAKKGTLFRRAYGTSTSSGPALKSIMTGQVPPVHGYRLQNAPTDSGPGGWRERLATQGWSLCDVQIDGIEAKKYTSEVDKCMSSSEGLVSINLSARTLSEADQAVGDLVKKWDAYHPDGLGILVGVTGNLEGARPDAALLITDDLVRIPLIVWGHGWEQDWEVDEVVSTTDVGPTVLEELGVESSNRNLKGGGSGVAYHESTVGYSAFGARPLVGFTVKLGRYVEGIYGRWYPAGKMDTRAFEDPESEYPDHEKQLKSIQSGFERSVGLPSGAMELSLDPAERISAMSLVTKFHRLLRRGQYIPARRVIDRIQAKSPDAAILDDLREKLKNASDGAPEAPSVSP